MLAIGAGCRMQASGFNKLSSWRWTIALMLFDNLISLRFPVRRPPSPTLPRCDKGREIHSRLPDRNSCIDAPSLVATGEGWGGGRLTGKRNDIYDSKSIMVTEFRFSLPCRNGGGLGWGPVAEERRESSISYHLRRGRPLHPTPPASLVSFSHNTAQPSTSVHLQRQQTHSVDKVILNSARGYKFLVIIGLSQRSDQSAEGRVSVMKSKHNDLWPPRQGSWEEAVDPFDEQLSRLLVQMEVDPRPDQRLAQIVESLREE